jgi:hypothetical protein
MFAQSFIQRRSCCYMFLTGASIRSVLNKRAILGELTARLPTARQGARAMAEQAAKMGSDVRLALVDVFDICVNSALVSN